MPKTVESLPSRESALRLLPGPSSTRSASTVPMFMSAPEWVWLAPANELASLPSSSSAERLVAVPAPALTVSGGFPGATLRSSAVATAPVDQLQRRTRYVGRQLAHRSRHVGPAQYEFAPRRPERLGGHPENQGEYHRQAHQEDRGPPH